MPTTPPDPLMTVREFREATQPGGWSRMALRRDLGAVDDKLADWHACRNNSRPLIDLLMATEVLLWSCMFAVNPRANKHTALSQKRLNELNKLGTEAMIWAKYLEFETRKESQKSGRFNRPTGPLAQGYDNERAMYVKYNKTQYPFSASALKEQIERMRQILRDGGNLDPALRALARKDLEDFTTDEFEAAITLLKQHDRIAEDKLASVIFMKKAQRRLYKILILGNDFFIDFNKKFKDELRLGIIYSYSIDNYGNIFVLRSNFDTSNDPRGDWVNHSTANAGKEVICAGCFTRSAVNNKITIDNNSGHYLPDRNQLHTAVSMIRDLGFDMSEWNVGIMMPPRPNPQLFNATDFLQNRNIRRNQRIGEVT